MMRETASAMTVSTPVWPTVAPGWRARLNDWITRYPELAFALGERQLSLRWQAPRASCIAAPEFALCMRFMCGGHALSVSLSGLEAVDARLVGTPFMGLPRSMRNLVVERLVAECISALPASLGQGMQLIDIDWPDAPVQPLPRHATEEAPTLAFECNSEASGAVSSGLISFTDPAMLDWVLERFAALPLRMLDGRALDTRIDIALGKSQIAADEIAAIAPGSFVWVDDAAVDRHGIRAQMHVATHAGPAVAQVSIKQRRVSVTERFNVVAHPVISQAAESEENMKIDVSKLALQVDFGLGELALPVGEIERVGPGYVFELPQEVADTEVLLRVSGQVIAAGEIVAIGRRLGVRITRMQTTAGQSHGAHGTEQTTAGN